MRLLCLPSPKAGSHKGQNGIVLIIGGGKTYHGAPILAAMAARRFCDLVYFSSRPENLAVLRKMKIASPTIIAVPSEKRAFALSHADCVLLGNGMDAGNRTRKAVASLLKSGKRCVLDAAALRVLPLRLLHSQAILTPHSREFTACFSLPATAQNAKKMSREHNCTIILKGKSDFIASAGKTACVSGGNAGMTKGGTGDVLAGLVAALYSRCDSPLRAACTASLLNKKAGERLFLRFGYNFSADDLAEELAAASKLFQRRLAIKR